MDGNEGAAPEAVEPSAPVESAPVESAPVETAPAEPVKNNPAWQPVLDVLPTSLHEIVAPTLKDWDRGVSERFEAIHKEYEPYKAYEQLVAAGVNPEDINAALGLVQQISEDPRAIYDSMREYYKFDEQTGEVTPAEPEAYDAYPDPRDERFAKLEGTVEQLASMLLSEREQASQAEMDQKFEGELSALKEKHGDYDREYVLTQIAAGLEPEAAVKAYTALVEKIKADSNRPNTPVVMGGGVGGVVVAPPSPSTMPAKDRKSFVADALRRAKSE